MVIIEFWYERPLLGFLGNGKRKFLWGMWRNPPFTLCLLSPIQNPDPFFSLLLIIYKLSSSLYFTVACHTIASYLQLILFVQSFPPLRIFSFGWIKAQYRGIITYLRVQLIPKQDTTWSIKQERHRFCFSENLEQIQEWKIASSEDKKIQFHIPGNLENFMT